jgi:hypothetical protein
MVVEVVTESVDTITTEHAEDVSLLLGELWRRFSAECSKAFLEEFLDSRQAEMSESGAVI